MRCQAAQQPDSEDGGDDIDACTMLYLPAADLERWAV